MSEPLRREGETHNQSFYRRNKEAQRARARAMYWENPAAQRNRHIFVKYGMTKAQYEEMVVKQGGLCAICGQLPTAINRPHLCVDHDHKTGRVRGLLCLNCNNGIGKLRDDPSLLEKAAAYLREHG